MEPEEPVPGTADHYAAVIYEYFSNSIFWLTTLLILYKIFKHKKNGVKWIELWPFSLALMFTIVKGVGAALAIERQTHSAPGQFFVMFPVAFLLTIFSTIVSFWIRLINETCPPFDKIVSNPHTVLKVNLCVNALMYVIALSFWITVVAVPQLAHIICGISDIVFSFFVVIMVLVLATFGVIMCGKRNSFHPAFSMFHEYDKQIKLWTGLAVISSFWMLFYSCLLLYDTTSLLTERHVHHSIWRSYLFRICEIIPVLSLCYMISEQIEYKALREGLDQPLIPRIASAHTVASLNYLKSRSIYTNTD